jgi:creatinine amidohydrolase
MRSYRLAELTSPEIGAAIAGGLDTVIIPVGSTEQHGPHLPMGTDSLHTVAVLERVAGRLGALVAPLMPVGRADHHMAFPGSMTVRHETLHAVIRDWCDSLFRHGFRRVLIYSGHGGNATPLARIIADLSAENPDREIIGCTDWQVYDDALFPVAAAEGVGIEAAGWHAGELEASMILALAPDQVLMGWAAPGFLGRLDDVRDVLMAEGLQAVSLSGVLGDPRSATRAHGEKYLAALTDAVTRHFQTAIAAREALHKSKSRETDA